MSLTALQKRRSTRTRRRHHKKTDTSRIIKKKSSKSPSRHSSRSSPKHRAATRLQKIFRGQKTRKTILGSPETCAICLENNVNNLNRSINQCVGKHPYHSRCINEWLERDDRHSCPTCRRPVQVTEEQKTLILLKRYSKVELNAMKKMFSHFIDSVKMVYEYKINKIPALESQILPRVIEAVSIIDEILDLKSMPIRSLKKSLATENINLIRLQDKLHEYYSFISSCVGLIRDYKSERIHTYRSAQMGIEYNPIHYHRYTGRPDYIARPPQTERGQAMTRRIRSR